MKLFVNSAQAVSRIFGQAQGDPNLGPEKFQTHFENSNLGMAQKLKEMTISVRTLLRFWCVLGVIFLLGSTSAWGMTTLEIRQAYTKSYSYEKLQDYGNAINSLATIIQQYPAGYTVNLRLGWLYYLKQNFANSLQNYKIAMKSAPSSIEARLGYMLPLLAQGRYDQVEAVAYQILETDRYNYYANLRLAIALRMEKKYEPAGKVLQQMLTFYPTDVTLLSELAFVRGAEGQIEAASAIFTDILFLDPENPTANAWLNQTSEHKK